MTPLYKPQILNINKADLFNNTSFIQKPK